MIQMSSEYWTARLIQNQYKKGTKRMDSQLIKVYQLASKELKACVNDLWLKMLQDGTLTQNGIYQYGRYIELQQQINKILKSLGQEEINIMNSQLQALYDATFTESARYLGGDVLGGFTLLNPKTAEEVVNSNFKGAIFSDRIWKRQDELKNQLIRVITNSAVLGQDHKRVARDLSKRLGVSLSDSRRLVRTETIRVLNSACINKAIERGYEYYRVLLEVDACDECLSEYEGKLFSLKGGNPPPLHPHCRCCIIVEMNEGERVDD